MTFTLTQEQLEIREAVARLCTRFGDDYWLKKDSEGGFPHEFHRAMAEGGWLGIAMPEEFGGSGLGITEAATVMQAVAQSQVDPGTYLVECGHAPEARQVVPEGHQLHQEVTLLGLARAEGVQYRHLRTLQAHGAQD